MWVPVDSLGPEVVQVLRDLNPWWSTGRVRGEVPPYKRRGVQGLLQRLSSRKGLIEVLRGPRQVGKTTAIQQAIDHLLSGGTKAADILFVRFDQELLRSRGGFIPIVRWFWSEISKRAGDEAATYLFLDEVHKLRTWDDDVKHVFDTFSPRIVLTGSSSVLVGRGGRESLAGRVVTTEMPTFQFREVLEAWAPIASRLAPASSLERIFSTEARDIFQWSRRLSAQQRHSLNRWLDKYYNRGGYPRLYNGEIGEDQWADYLSETIIDRVLGGDVPDLFPVQNPLLLRWLYVEVARATGNELSQNRLAEDANAAGFATSQPNIGTYLHLLMDTLLIREFRRYPLARRANARVPSKFTLTDLGARNAIFRGAPSLWESSPEHVGPLVETLVQSVLRGPGLDVHFWRDYENPRDRRSRILEVDFVAEDTSGAVVPIEVKFRRRIDSADFAGLHAFLERYNAPLGIMVTRETAGHWPLEKTLCVPLLDFLLTF